jgi:folate-binding protein YgfZ
MTIQAPPELEAHYRVMREGVGLLDRSERGKLDVEGPDAGEYLQGQLTNDIEALQPGHGCHAALLNPKGRILAEMRVLLRSLGQVWLDCEPAALEPMLSNLSMYKIGRQVELFDRTAERAIISLIGPRARETAGVDLPAGEHTWVEAEIEAVSAVLTATDLGVDLILPAAQAEDVRSALADRGALPVTEQAAEILRVESGRPRYGLDMSAENLPGEVGLEQRAVSFTKGCYVGQEPVARMHYRGHPNRYLRGLRLSQPAVIGEPLFSAGKEIGKVTSACVSPNLGPIALAIVRREIDPESDVELAAGRAARVIELPFRAP